MQIHDQSKLGALDHSINGQFLGVIRLYVGVPCGYQGLFHSVFCTGCAEYLMFLHVSWCYTHACQSSMCVANFLIHESGSSFWLVLLNVHKTLTLRMCQDILDLELWDLALGPSTASKSGTSWDVPEYPRTSWTWDSGT